jgi:ornithine decarboxylase
MAIDTPYLTMNLQVVAARYSQLREALPAATVLYAVKANPAPEVVRLLAQAGSSFDVASRGEIDLCLNAGIEPARLSYGNTIKKERDISYAFCHGIRVFTVDSPAELEKVIRNAPGSTAYIRITTDGAGADWPLSRKFGCDEAAALELLRAAARAGLKFGISFHVGSQQRNPQAWDRPLEQVAALYRVMRDEGYAPAGVNLGGGLPSRHRESTPGIDEYGSAIRRALQRRLGSEFKGDVLIEPGRYLVGDAGVIEAEVVLIAERSCEPGRRWVYLDIGMFNGLAETLDEAIRYRIHVPGRGGPMGPVAIAGPTCDSADVLYEHSDYELPLNLQIGDRVQLLAAGAYTSSYSSVCFNGFEPLRTYFLPASRPSSEPRSRSRRDRPVDALA